MMAIRDGRPRGTSTSSSLVGAALLAALVGAACASSATPGTHESRGGARSEAHAARRALARLPRAEDVRQQPAGDLARDAAARRLALAARLPEGVVWLEAPSEPKTERFHQDDDVLYLSGQSQPDIVMALRIGADGELLDEVLFLPPHDVNWEVWNGRRLTPGPESRAASRFLRTEALDLRTELLEEWAPATVLSLAPLRQELPPGTGLDTTRLRRELDALRLIKSDYELDCLQAAIDVTGAALHEAAILVQPGRHEYEVQGVLEGAFLRLGAERPGFASICGSGPNSVTLHYVANRRLMQSGDLIVIDVGAKVGGYSADITRTLPVSGRFTPRQREVYETVLAAQQAAAAAARPGMTLRELDAVARKVIGDAGFGYGRETFKHGVGHWLGLNVHDVGGPRPLQPGMTFTLEPGIYLADEALGVRIEDDYLMTAEGAVRLSTAFPTDPDEIEALLGAR